MKSAFQILLSDNSSPVFKKQKKNIKSNFFTPFSNTI